MMKRIYLILILAMPLVMACEDFIDRPPLDQISTNDYWKSSADLQNYTAQFYLDFVEGHDGIPSASVRYEENSDNIVSTGVNNLLSGRVTPATGTWKSQWEIIRTINIFFDNYSRCEDDFSTWQHYLGEAQFFKAYHYFQLVKRYGDVPWYTHSLMPDDEELMKARNPRTQVVDSLLILLDQAFVNISGRNDAPWGNNSINKEAVLAFKTRVALFEGTWQKYHAMLNDQFSTPGANPDKYFQACVDAAEELMNGNYRVGIYNTGNPETDYFDLFSMSNMGSIDEVLLYKAYNIDEGYGHNANFYATTYPFGYGTTWSYVTSHLGRDGDSFDYLGLAETTKGNDFMVAIANNCDPRLHQNVWIPGEVISSISNIVWDKPPIDEGGAFQNSSGFQFRKYTNTTQTLNYADENDQGFIIFRYAEVLLNYAEAKYELDGVVAYEQLNQLRARAGMPDFTIIPQSTDPNRLDYGYSIPDELYEIRRERRVETVFEGLREMDWRRWAAHALFTGKRFKGYPFKQDEFPELTVHLDENGLIDILQSLIPNGNQFRPNQDYLYSIPLQELTLNPNLEQNPGWDN
ncbi:RagB/SusD family nutrient uptake outer membrane protein [Mariniphaga sediminis]|uniref:RagB/SusD family nutrient uptake outer membrane protein n=1 Tax=Mariniphaga sediminis TaxID=1628158 RepID=A0A399CXH6_9BACT|nr:RagB/SusD family nutrient uptake outer membrane protein [Mariniphaga sediminis]RIH63916.1 RagB/SusD family nutrient uptake outer membrane protein [Mariniphaga sediminis]